MKVLLLTTLFTVSSALAQTAPQPPQPPVPGASGGTQRGRVRMVSPGNNSSAPILAENLQVLLTLSDKDAPSIEVSVITAGANFSTTVTDLALNFTGTIGVDENGGLSLSYALTWEPAVLQLTGGTQSPPRQTSTTGNILVKTGEEVQIFRAGSRSAKLVLKKTEATAGK